MPAMSAILGRLGLFLAILIIPVSQMDIAVTTTLHSESVFLANFAALTAPNDSVVLHQAFDTPPFFVPTLSPILENLPKYPFLLLFSVFKG